MNSIQLLKEKDNEEYFIFDKKILENIKKMFKTSTTKTKKIENKKLSNVFKNKNFKIKKNKISNKIILILNKIGETNQEQLIKDFIDNIDIKDDLEYEELQKEIYLKLIKDIKFINYYIKFITNIFKIVYYKIKLLPKYFYFCINEKLKLDYEFNYKCELNFLSSYNTENYRNNNLIIIFNLIQNDYFCISKNQIFEYITNLILNQNKYYTDIYYWCELSKVNLDNKYDKIIISKLKLLKENSRDYILLSSVLNQNESIISKNVINVDSDEENINVDRFLIEIQNILEEYIYLKCDNEIFEFINSFCNDYNKKNIFCNNILNYYFLNDYENINWLNLFNILIKKKYIFKSNLSNSLTYNLKNEKKCNINKIKKLLIFLKQNNITKNIEYLFKQYNIKLNHY